MDRQRNTGKCDTKLFPYKTYYTTNTNITAYLNNNVINYEEVGFSDSITDGVKNQTKKYDKEIYKKQLNNVVGKLELFLKKDKNFLNQIFKIYFLLLKEKLQIKEI